MSQYNRRTIVRGAAWTLPVVAVASTAPAFAASTDAPIIGGSGAFVSCKQAGLGGTNCQGYRITINLTVQPSDTWDVVFTNVTLNGVNYTTSTEGRTVAVTATASSVTLVVCTQTNSQGPVTLQLAYTATNRRTKVATSSSGSYNLGVVAPCK